MSVTLSKQESRAAHKRAWIIDMIQLWALEHDGVAPRVNDWRHVGGTEWPSYLTVYRYFDSWDDAISAAGFIPRGRGRPMQL